ncbi:unnamed protein product [Polarella glacialis]|uniref:Subtilisin n=1 Tax=Polarella glacialis TaxID=89957 RepID=A0A813K2J3_POLGL|nr:unnamed protein product [Polarella glacialis]
MRAQRCRVGRALWPLWLLATVLPAVGLVYDADCLNAEPRSECNDKVLWAMNQGFEEKPASFVGLTVHSSFRDFQAFFHNARMYNCSRPCFEEEEPCVVFGQGYPCLGDVTWAMHEGLPSHPQWYPLLTPGKATALEMAQTLYQQGHPGCPRPCGAGELYGHSVPYVPHVEYAAAEGWLITSTATHTGTSTTNTATTTSFTTTSATSSTQTTVTTRTTSSSTSTWTSSTQTSITSTTRTQTTRTHTTRTQTTSTGTTTTPKAETMPADPFANWMQPQQPTTTPLELPAFSDIWGFPSRLDALQTPAMRGVGPDAALRGASASLAASGAGVAFAFVVAGVCTLRRFPSAGAQFRPNFDEEVIDQEEGLMSSGGMALLSVSSGG